MKRLVWIVLCAAALAACVESACPEGSAEVSGTCKTVESVEDGDGDGGNPDGGAEPDAGESSAADASTEDAAVDVEDKPDADAAMVEPCELLSCGDNAHCEAADDEASCVCDEGFEGDGSTCEVNACADDPCDSETSTCNNEDGEAVCECLEGFARCDGDAFSCTTDLQTDATHCGACDAACAGNLECSEGACEQRITQLSLGSEHSCALAPDGEILCWGSNTDERLLREVSAPGHEAIATRLGKARLLAAGPTSSCAVLMNGELVCWGSNNPVPWIASGAQRGSFTLASGLAGVESISVGVFAACLLVDGEAQCWGISQTFDAGSELVSFAERRSITLPSDIVQLFMGRELCAVSLDRRVRCWGNGSSTVVIGDADGPLTDVEHVAVSTLGVASCALLSDGRIECWGTNDKGQLGNADTAVGTTRVTTAVPVTDLAGTVISEFVQVAVGQNHGCGLRQDNTVLCWGQVNRLGSGGTSSAAQSYATEVSDLKDALEVAAGAQHTCVRRKSGQVQCWGDNTAAQLGVPLLSVGGVGSSAVPANVTGLP